MNSINAALRSLTEGYVHLFGGLHPLVSLAPVSVITGIAMLWVFGKTSNQSRIERTKKRLQAYLLELRLYGDEPSLLFRAQWDLLRNNVRYILLMMKPALYLAVPTILLLLHLDAVYGKRPLRPGESAVVTMQAAARLAQSSDAPKVSASEGLHIDTAPVRALEIGQFAWRVTAERPGDGVMYIEWLGEQLDKRVALGAPGSYVSDRLVNGWLNGLLYPTEDSISSEYVSWIEVAHPGAEIETGGIHLHWLIWFLVLSIVPGYLLKDRFGVTL